MNIRTLIAAIVAVCFMNHAGADAPAGIEGVMHISPFRGGPVREGDPASRPLPNIEFEVKKGDDVVATFTTGDDGTFRVTLPPGHYTVVRKNWHMKVGRFGPFEVDVPAGEMKKVQWVCDSGMQ